MEEHVAVIRCTTTTTDSVGDSFEKTFLTNYYFCQSGSRKKIRLPDFAIIVTGLTPKGIDFKQSIEKYDNFRNIVFSRVAERCGEINIFCSVNFANHDS